ncbi:unnamed protein product [Amoebophrya sp. A120]|nr:unnamed protein product [Amoebophrya sp. A120]|eukprot:GSA120T00018061001.1
MPPLLLRSRDSSSKCSQNLVAHERKLEDKGVVVDASSNARINQAARQGTDVDLVQRASRRNANALNTSRRDGQTMIAQLKNDLRGPPRCSGWSWPITRFIRMSCGKRLKSGMRGSYIEDAEHADGRHHQQQTSILGGASESTDALQVLQHTLRWMQEYCRCEAVQYQGLRLFNALVDALGVRLVAPQNAYHEPGSRDAIIGACSCDDYAVDHAPETKRCAILESQHRRELLEALHAQGWVDHMRDAIPLVLEDNCFDRLEDSDCVSDFYEGRVVNSNSASVRHTSSTTDAKPKHAAGMVPTRRRGEDAGEARRIGGATCKQKKTSTRAMLLAEVVAALSLFASEEHLAYRMLFFREDNWGQQQSQNLHRLTSHTATGTAQHSADGNKDWLRQTVCCALRSAAHDSRLLTCVTDLFLNLSDLLPHLHTSTVRHQEALFSPEAVACLGFLFYRDLHSRLSQSGSVHLSSVLQHETSTGANGETGTGTTTSATREIGRFPLPSAGAFDITARHLERAALMLECVSRVITQFFKISGQKIHLQEAVRANSAGFPVTEGSKAHCPLALPKLVMMNHRRGVESEKVENGASSPIGAGPPKIINEGSRRISSSQRDCLPREELLSLLLDIVNEFRYFFFSSGLFLTKPKDVLPLT